MPASPGTVFFFQAEDGIRDGHVTGVQTCALPISGDAHLPAGAAELHPHAAPGARGAVGAGRWLRASAAPPAGRTRPAGPCRSPTPTCTCGTWAEWATPGCSGHPRDCGAMHAGRTPRTCTPISACGV